MFFGNFLIAMREGLEAALVVSVLVAYLVKLGRRDLLPRLWLGVTVAALLPLAIGALLTWGPYGMTFQAQEILGGTLSLVAVGMITWMILWMAGHAREQKAGLERSLDETLDSARAGRGVMLLALLSVGRESLETALFVWMTTKSSMTHSVIAPISGVVIGLIVAIVLGWAIYAGAVKLDIARFFRWSGVFLIVVAAGIVSYGIGDLQEAGVLPGHGTFAWNLSHLVPTHGVGQALHAVAVAITNVNPSPTWLQVIGWWAYLLVVMPLFVRKAFPRRKQVRPAPAGTTAQTS